MARKHNASSHKRKPESFAQKLCIGVFALLCGPNEKRLQLLAEERMRDLLVKAGLLVFDQTKRRVAAPDDNATDGVVELKRIAVNEQRDIGVARIVDELDLDHIMLLGENGTRIKGMGCDRDDDHAPVTGGNQRTARRKSVSSGARCRGDDQTVTAHTRDVVP